jgi:hypothetical protein
MIRCGFRLAMFVTAAVFAAQAWSADSTSTKKVPRLRFKDGPVCMCVNGLSEAQIQAAAKARQAGANGNASPAMPIAPTRKEHDQQKAGGR